MKLRTIPFGYKMEQGEIVLHTEEADIVRGIYNHYIDGCSYNAITKRLNDDGIQYHPGAVWNKHMVKRILESRRYLGEQGYPPIIPAADFDAVTERKAENPQCRPKQRNPKDIRADYRILPYEPTVAVRRLNNDINRALERTPDPNKIRPLIFECAAEKYAAIKTIGAMCHE